MTNCKYYIYVEINVDSEGECKIVGAGGGECVKGDVKEFPVMG